MGYAYEGGDFDDGSPEFGGYTQVDGNVKATNVDNTVKVTKLLVEDIEDNVKGIKGQVEGVAVVARSVDNGTQWFPSVFTQILTVFPIVSKHSRTRS